MRTANPASYKLIERPIYGSSRVGIDNTPLELIGYTAPTSGIYTHLLGLKQYELVNHLGNVLTTVSDKKIPVDLDYDGTIDYYVADITSATDYYPFGSPMDGRAFSGDNYRFGFNGQEKDDEVAGAGNINTAMFWEYDTRLGRRWNLDPKPQISISDYAVMANSPILLNDLFGDDVDVKFKGKDGKTHTYDYKPGEKHNEDNPFLIKTVNALNEIYSTKNGKLVIDALEKSKNLFHVSDKTSSEPNTLKFLRSPSGGGGGTIQAGFISKMKSQGQVVDVFAHELFHGLQHEMKEKFGTTNCEVGAYLFGKSISLNLGYGISSFGTFSPIGQKYDKAMKELLWANKPDVNLINLYRTAINTFKAGSIGNKGGVYTKNRVNNSEINPLIKMFFPLIAN